MVAFLAPISQVLLPPEQVLSGLLPSKSLMVVTAGLRINREHEPGLLGREAAREFS